MGSIRAALALCSLHGRAVVPRWIGAGEHPRIVAMLEVYRALVGQPRARLDERLEGETSAPGARLVRAVLDASFPTRVVAAVAPPRARAAVFEAAARDRRGALARAAREFGVAPDELEQALFADLPAERRLQEPALPVTLSEVMLRCNHAIAQAALASSSSVRIELEGHARAVVRHAHLRGLICTAARGGGATTLEVSGPLALFRRTALYGRHLAELVPLLGWSRGFRLEAECELPRGAGTLVLDPLSPLRPSEPPRRYDSKLEERFARDFLRLASEWDLVREPEPIAVEGTLIFPDFALVHRRDPARRWLLEILGYWTAEYVETKLRRLGAAGVDNLILCIDAARDCGRHALPASVRVLRFEKRVDVQRVLEVARSESPPLAT